MKKNKFLLAALCATMLFPLTACGGNGEQSSEGTPEPQGSVTLCDFETYRSDFQPIRVLNHFGSINMNTDTQYVKSGKASAKLQPLGGYISPTNPLMYYPLYSPTYGFDYRNLSKMREITAELYNAEDSDIKMDFGLVMEVPNTDLVNKTNPMKVTLKPGWNTVTYEVDVSVINILYDIENAQGVYFGFERVGSRDIEDAPVLYLDDICLHYSKTAAQVEDLLSFESNEVCSFDKLYQRYVIYDETENPVCAPAYTVVNTGDLGVEATSGKYALKVTTFAGEKNYASYQKIVIPEGIMAACDMSKVKEEEWDKWYFCFDLYALDQGLTFYPEFFDQGYGSCWNNIACDANVGVWTTYAVPFKSLIEKGKNMVAKPGFFRLAWAEYEEVEGVASERDFLIDSFRIEKRG